MIEGFSTPAAYPMAASRDEVVNALFRRVYQWMAAGLILTAVAAYVVASNQALIQMFYGSSAPMVIVAVAEVGLVMWLSMGINRISASTAAVLFTVYSVLNGILCSSVLLVYTQESVYKAFFSTAGMFGLMSVYGLFTKRNLTNFGSFLVMGLFGLVIAMVINMFLRSSAMEFYLSLFGVIIFLGLTAWDTWKIRTYADQVDSPDGEMARKMSIIGALALYLDFINIFLYLLRFFGKQKR